MRHAELTHGQLHTSDAEGWCYNRAPAAVEVQAGNVHKHQCSEYGAEGGEWRRIDRPKDTDVI